MSALGERSLRFGWAGASCVVLACSARATLPPSRELGRRPEAAAAGPRQKRVFCASLVDRFDVPRCLQELTPEQQRGRSWTFALTFEDDRVVRKDTVNGRGVLVDDDSRIASRIYRYDGDRVVEIEGRSRDGVVRAHTRFVREDGANVVIWLDEQDRPFPIAETRAVAAARELDEWGQVVEVVYADWRGKSAVNADGVAAARRRYDATGHLLSETNFDASLAPTTSKEGVHEIRYEVDAWGEMIEKSYFGTDGAPVLNTRTRIHATRYQRDAFHNSIEWAYYGVNGEPVVCPIDDIAVGRFGRNEFGSEVSLDYYGPSGERRKSAYGYATRREKLDATEATIEWSHFDLTGAPTSRNFGHSVLLTTRDARGNETRDAYLDTSRKPVRTRDGYAEIRMAYDERDNCVSFAYFDEKGEPALTASGYHSASIEFDGDRKLRTVYAGAFGIPVNTSKGYSEYVTNYEEGGGIAGHQYFTAEGLELKPLPVCKGSFEPSQKVALNAALAPLLACSPKADASSLVLRLNLDEQGRAKSFKELGERPDDATSECLKGALVGVRLPAPTGGCANVTLELTPGSPRKVRILTVGDAPNPEQPPG